MRHDDTIGKQKYCKLGYIYTYSDDWLMKHPKHMAFLHTVALLADNDSHSEHFMRWRNVDEVFAKTPKFRTRKKRDEIIDELVTQGYLKRRKNKKTYFLTLTDKAPVSFDTKPDQKKFIPIERSDAQIYSMLTEVNCYHLWYYTRVAGSKWKGNTCQKLLGRYATPGLTPDQYRLALQKMIDRGFFVKLQGFSGQKRTAAPFGEHLRGTLVSSWSIVTYTKSDVAFATAELEFTKNWGSQKPRKNPHIVLNKVLSKDNTKKSNPPTPQTNHSPSLPATPLRYNMGDLVGFEIDKEVIEFTSQIPELLFLPDSLFKMIQMVYQDRKQFGKRKPILQSEQRHWNRVLPSPAETDGWFWLEQAVHHHMLAGRIAFNWSSLQAIREAVITGEEARKAFDPEQAEELIEQASLRQQAALDSIYSMEKNIGSRIKKIKGA